MKIIISENQVDKIKSKIHEYVKKYGFEKSREIFGDKVLLTIGFNNDPMEFLNLFNDLDVVQSTKEPGYVLYRFKKVENYFVEHRRKVELWVCGEIWLTLKNGFNLHNVEISQLIREWFNDETGKIIIPQHIGSFYWLSEMV